MHQYTKQLFREISSNAYSDRLSQLLPKLLTVAKRLEYQELENWARLELEGYLASNPALTEETIVPEYRTVAGTRSDEWGRPLVIQDPNLHFINEDRLRQGVAELERIASLENDITVRDISRSEILRRELGVEVTRFSFHPSSVEGVLSAIRSRMVDWLYKVEKKYPKLEIKEPDEKTKKIYKGRFRGLRVFGVTILIISILAFLIIAVDYFFISIFPLALINPYIVIITAFTLSIGLLLQVKKVYEFIDKVFPK